MHRHEYWVTNILPILPSEKTMPVIFSSKKAKAATAAAALPDTKPVTVPDTKPKIAKQAGWPFPEGNKSLISSLKVLPDIAEAAAAQKTAAKPVQSVALESALTLSEAQDGTSVQDMTDSQLVDAHGLYQEKVAFLMVNPLFAKAALIQAEVTKRLNEADPLESPTWTGEKFTLAAGPKAKASPDITDMPKVKEYLGDEMFMKLAKVSKADLDKYLNPQQLEVVLDPEPGHINKRKIVLKPILKL